MINQEVAIRYSKALSTLGGSKEEKIDLLNRLGQSAAMLENTPEFQSFANSPLIDREQKKEVLRNSFKSIANGNETVRNFLLLLLEKERLRYLPAIVEEYCKYVHNEFDIVDAKIITAVPMDTDLSEKFKTQLEQKLSKQVKLKEEVDPSLIGGGILIIGDRMTDFSVKGQLEQLKEDLLLTTV